MKKVTLLGVAGLAPVVAGLAWPTAGAAAAGAAAVTHTKGPGKTASLTDGHPLTLCTPYKNFNYDSKGLFSGYISYSKQCVTWQEGRLWKSQTGLTERVRFYSGGGALEDTRWLHGAISFSRHQTNFQSTPYTYAHEICQALVSNNNHNNVKYGPVCEFTS